MAVYLTVYEIFNVKVSHDLENWVKSCSRSLKMVPFDRPYTTFYWSAIVNIALSGTVFWLQKFGCSFILAFHSKYVSILHQFRDKARYWSKTVIFSYPFAFDARGSPSEYWHPIWYGKTRMVGLLDGEKTLRICITVYTQYWRVTDRQTSCQGWG